MAADVRDIEQRSINAWKRIRTLGKGAFGEVALMEAPGGRQFAVKKLYIRKPSARG
jgi:hypothetical protein